MKKVEVTIHSDGSPVPINQFSEYFQLLRVCYILALEEIRFEMEDGDIAVDTSVEHLSGAIIHHANSLSAADFNRLTKQKLSTQEELYIQDIMRRNPFEIVFLGIGVALTAALIVSGGKFEFGLTKLKIEIPPLGEGIAKLKQAFKQK
ncbi:hypothetical protein BZG20_13205 [Salinivibrio sp. IB868]|uniref:hypothetical protein n=1 Tax=unclassified Salinivibrio TaxID=2636825 RepID=UPI0009844D67|nr:MULTISPECIES: hypothetical protein [unclassified Salinivibrio]OOE65065.1 hypothetical protein BZG20_13205 [Salinivibrio sp. IB868]OOE75089.1 hypothetical protein BZG22_06825 [Salinivibrio sp. IB870]